MNQPLNQPTNQTAKAKVEAKGTAVQESGGLCGMISPVSNAVKVCQQGATGGGGIAPTLAKQPLTGNEQARPCDASVTFTNTKRNRRGNVTVKTCQQCGAEYVTRRPKQSRYCSPVCRRGAWLAANPERAAQLAEGDKARLKAHLEAKGIAWEDR
jgi:hypothetical protein